MNATLIIAGLSSIVLGITTYTVTQSNDTCHQIDPLQEMHSFRANAEDDFLYQVENRFNSTITKEHLKTASTVFDIFPMDATKNIETFKNVEITIVNFEGVEQKKSFGTDEQLTEEQLSMLTSTDYSTDFFVKGDFTNANNNPEHLIYYMTIIPEQEAVYQPGNIELINYLKSNSENETKDIKRELLRPGKVRFTVNTDGTIKDVQLDATSGFNTVDWKMIELITSLPGKWTPAENAKGEKVAQQFVFSFGIIGC